MWSRASSRKRCGAGVSRWGHPLKVPIKTKSSPTGFQPALRAFVSPESLRGPLYLPDYDVYVEYWGMIDVEDGYKRREYERKIDVCVSFAAKTS